MTEQQLDNKFPHRYNKERSLNRYAGSFAILGVWTNWFVWTGAIKSLAVLLPTLQDQMATYTWVIGWVIAITEVAADLTGNIC